VIFSFSAFTSADTLFVRTKFAELLSDMRAHTLLVVNEHHAESYASYSWIVTYLSYDKVVVHLSNCLVQSVIDSSTLWIAGTLSLTSFQRKSCCHAL
jgi:hypothetical protein